MKFFLNHETWMCTRCGSDMDAHVFHCAGCGAAAELTTCTCGKKHAPRLTCVCNQVGLYCPTEKRVVTRQVLAALEEERRFMLSLERGRLSVVDELNLEISYRWEIGEAKRLFAKIAS